MGVTASNYSDYSGSDEANFEYALTPDEWTFDRLVETTSTSATTVVTSFLTSISSVVVTNTDSANACKISWVNLSAGATTAFKIPAGATIVVYDVTPANSLVFTADTAAVVLRVSITGT